LFTPLFYVVCRWLGTVFARRKPVPKPQSGPAE
jgi:HAE1 family hydrophobic/amphiphilic exporter-1